ILGNLSFFLGGKTAEEGHRWSPNLRAVRGSDQVCDKHRPFGCYTDMKKNTNEPSKIIRTNTAQPLVDRPGSAAEDGMLNIWRIWPSSRPVTGTSEAGKCGEE
ncbi:hypothetical protein FOFC_18386, partial [Fusarium oxysporum]